MGENGAESGQQQKLKLMNEVMRVFGLPCLDKYGQRNYPSDYWDSKRVWDIRSNLCTHFSEVAGQRGLGLPLDWKERIQAGIDEDIAREQGGRAPDNRGTLCTFFALKALTEEVVGRAMDADRLARFTPAGLEEHHAEPVLAGK